MDAETAETELESAARQRFVTSPHNRPRCPVHGVRLHVRSSVGRVAYLRCPAEGCGHVDKMAREVLQDES
jgi:hypothetical protein